MGVNGGMKCLMGFTPRKINLRNPVGFRDRDNLYVLIDALSVLCRYAIGSLNSREYVIDRKGHKVIEVYYLFIIAVRFLSLGIVPVFVFDGRAPDLKAETVEKRGQAKDKADEILKTIRATMDKMDDVDIVEDDDEIDEQNPELIDTDSKGTRTPVDLDEYIKFLKRSYRPNTQNVETAKLLLRWMGVPVIDAPGEADSQCAAIAAHYTSKVIGVITDDFDALMYSSPNVLKLPSLGSNTIDEFSLCDTLENLSLQMSRVISGSNDAALIEKYAGKQIKMTHQNLIEIGCMMGNDYCSSGLRIKPVNGREKFDTILELYAKYDMTIESVLNAQSSTLSTSQMKRIMDACNMYTNAKVLDPNKISITMREPSLEMVKKMCRDFLKDEDINNVVNMLANIYKSRTRIFIRQGFSTDESGTLQIQSGSHQRAWMSKSNDGDSFSSFSSYKARYAREMMKNNTRAKTNVNANGNPIETVNSNGSCAYGYSTKSWPEPMFKVPITIC